MPIGNIQNQTPEMNKFSEFVTLLGVLVVVILCISDSVLAEDPNDEKEPVDEIEDDHVEGSDVLKALGQLKTSRVLRTTYYLSRIQTDWFSARQHCIDHRLRLLSIEDLEEDSEITTFLNEERVTKSWTSGNDLDKNGNFLWASTHRPMVYTNWHRLGAPRDPRRSCVFTATDRYWGDGTYGWDEEYCAVRMNFICEETL